MSIYSSIRESKKTGKVVEAGIISVFAKCYWTTFVVGGIMRLGIFFHCIS